MTLRFGLTGFSALMLASITMSGVNVGPAQSQTIKAAPSEWPNPKYRGGIYVDTTGCVYLRALTAAGLTWEPRLTPDDIHMCGYSPTGSAAMPFAQAPKVATSEPLRPQQVTQALPDTPLSTQPEPKPAPEVVAKPSKHASTSVTATATPVEPPAATQVITNEASKEKTPTASALKKNSDQGTAGLYVQIALFAQPENTTKTVSRLTKIGLPIQTRQVTLNEKRFTNVVAGPFTQRAEANEALSTIQQQGFKDAYLR